MQAPLHPIIVHFPIAITFILPFIIVVFAFMIRSNKMAPKSWLIVTVLQLFVVVTGYVALETGENEEDVVEKIVSKKLIHEHEEAAEIFVGSTVLALVLSVAAFFIRKEISFPLKLAIAGLTIISSYLAYRTGELGGGLVYKHGAAAAYSEITPVEGLLPTPDLNTSESPNPLNESLKPDDNDYGNEDEDIESPEEMGKQED
jgi:uncharacterized membrane protein